MFYQTELSFLRSFLQKCHLAMHLVDPSEPAKPHLDLGLRMTLGWDAGNSLAESLAGEALTSNVLYKLTDIFSCNYLFLRLPEPNPELALVIGPYLTKEPIHEELLVRAERAGLSPKQFELLERAYVNIPLVHHEATLLHALEAFADRIWGGADQYTIRHISQENTFVPAVTQSSSEQSEDHLWKLQALEQRYATENQLIQAVAAGLTYKAEMILGGFSQHFIEQRAATPIRNIKNYCIIMNTLLRKAAEQGGVHPLYLDRHSSAFGKKIESLPDAGAIPELLREMIHGYCHLVKKHSTRSFSPVVQKTIVLINSDLTADLRLQTLANLQNINASYLSDLFKRETGQTLTAYVQAKRMQHAARLLESTTLQIQTIAQYCGISDVNYFSRTFKRCTGKTPKEYRTSPNHV